MTEVDMILKWISKELFYWWLVISSYVGFYFRELFHIPHPDETTTKSKSNY